MKTLLKKRETLLRRIADCSEFLRGSITSVCSTCNRATCICTGKPTGRAYRLTYKTSGQKTRTVYLSHSQRPKARVMLANHAKRRKLTEELLEINIAIFKLESKLQPSPRLVGNRKSDSGWLKMRRICARNLCGTIFHHPLSLEELQRKSEKRDCTIFT